MGEKKKSGASWEERTQLGPYQLEEQVPQPAHSKGELYRARHEKSGATALVLKPAAEEDVAKLKNWRVRIISSIAPSYIAMAEVELVGACWLPVVGIQIQMRRIADAAPSDMPLPARYFQLSRMWFLLGWPAFIGVIVIFWLMVTKPEFAW